MKNDKRFQDLRDHEDGHGESVAMVIVAACMVAGAIMGIAGYIIYNLLVPFN